jgi:hypothetical protein
MEDDSKFRDRRTKVRIPFIYGIEFEQAEDSTLSAEEFFKDQDTNVIIRDISESGIQILSPKYIPEGIEVRLVLRFPRHRKAPVEYVDNVDCIVHAQVKWVKKVSTEKGFRAGLLFTKFEGNAEEIVRKYLKYNITSEEDVIP